MATNQNKGMSTKQVIILLFLGALIILVLFLGLRLMTKPPAALPHTLNPLAPNIRIFVDFPDPNHPVFSGTTNLPNETIIMISLWEETGNLSGQDKVQVSNGSFRSAVFGPDGGLDYGTYTVEALMPVPNVQPESVQRVIGPNGENLVGSQVFNEGMGVIVRAETNFDIIEPTPQVWDCYGPGIGITKVHEDYQYEVTLHQAYKSDEAFGETPGMALGKDYELEFIIVEFTYKNLSDAPDLISADQFQLNVSDDYALGDDYERVSYRGEAIFNSEAWEAGFFEDKEILPGDSYTGMVAFIVPDISNNYVLSTSPYSNSCYVKDQKLYCSQDSAWFQFRD
jgi:hypothetical protein